MAQIALLLLGAQAVQRHWLRLATIGLGWMALGLVVVTAPLDGVEDMLDGVHHVTMHLLGALLMIEGAVTLLSALLSERTRWLRVVRGLALFVPGFLIVETPWRNLMLISVLFGLALTVDGAVRIAGTLLVRFPGWRVALAAGGVELVLAVLALTPWPVPYEATVPFCVGVALMLSGRAVLHSALLLRRLPPDAPITSLPIFESQRGWYAPVPMTCCDGDRDGACEEHGREMTVYVWTPLASATDPVRRPLLDRYVAAADRHGTVSTGHAALGMLPDLYISHYRVEEHDRSSLEFRQALHAGVQNNAPGRFLPSYEEEAAGWCEATARVVFRHFDQERLQAFWAAYRQDPTYNLTNRNCSVVVALALDAALEGVLGRTAAVWPPLLRLIIHPDLYLAAVLRKRARTMTWTPGLVLDYARALRHVVEPSTGMSWLATLLWAAERYRRTRRPLLSDGGAAAASRRETVA